MLNEEMENDTPKNESVEESSETPEGENLNKKSKELQSALAQKEHFKAKFEQSQKEIEELKKVKPIPSGEPKKESTPIEMVRLARALEGFSEEEVDFITRNATEKSIDGIINASKDEWVRTAIQARREKVERESKTPEPSTKQGVGESNKELKDMTLDEKDEWFKKRGFIKGFPKPKSL